MLCFAGLQLRLQDGRGARQLHHARELQLRRLPTVPRDTGLRLLGERSLCLSCTQFLEPLEHIHSHTTHTHTHTTVLLGHTTSSAPLLLLALLMLRYDAHSLPCRPPARLASAVTTRRATRRTLGTPSSLPATLNAWPSGRG